ncbi:type I secretion system permease/ATPase [Marinomonas mediterranea]|jgi:type I secretion system ATPase, LssB family|uniref:Type I secretion system ATPase n=1 Tax=Marinomonas mediterranea (strain ATCC 700492 / JCM 21426 / NBRC 103028 / MMB-1) TaxID=717774 RepID=F2JY31_MARM1|nr:type I secretion system permease/ATPase [Marinomonas mediterranea]ADZ90767.1 type I secretion system ATPase [Marinomonas mediterranea MMB-1]WCN08808.1 type I secretion system permease/ATPase [Marinomonas mediterranea]WCN12854.1 type I secretion system permease/ATPase [Marinomonas mediterranea]WCN16922.1 type I secretion system permease/ATPase [Marinomonas mediterranea MMB-1]
MSQKDTPNDIQRVGEQASNVENEAVKESTQNPSQTEDNANADQIAEAGVNDTPTKEKEQWEIDASLLEYPNQLLDCLALLSKYFDNPYTADAIAAGLPITDNEMTPELFQRAAKRIGINSRFVKRNLKNISSMVLPVVLLLEDKKACVLLEVNQEQGVAKVFRPESGEGEVYIKLDKLEKVHTGYVFFVRPVFRFDKRSESKAERFKKGHWFWGTISRSWRIYRDVLVASLLINLFAVASPLFVMNVYDRVVPNNAFDTLWVLAIGAASVYLFDFLLRTLRSYFIDIAGKKSDILLSASIFSRVNNMKMEARPKSVGAFAKNLQEFESIREFITSATITTLVDLPFMFLIIGVIWLIGGPVSFIPLVTIFLILAYSVIIQRPLKRSIEESQKTASQKNALLIESLVNAESVKLNRAEGVLQKQWEGAVGNIADWGVKTRQLAQSCSAFAQVAQQLTTVVMVIAGVYQISEGNMSMGALIASVMLTGRALGPMAQIAGLATRYNQAKSALGAINEIMSAPVENPEDVKYVHRPAFEGNFQFDGVAFSYPEQEQTAISNVGFTIKPGEKVAIIGRIGSGKSTLGKIMTGLYAPSQGAVRVDGVDMRQINPADLRRNIGAVSQDVSLFYGSIRDNIVMGVPYIEDEAILRAADLSGVSEFANRRASGLDSDVGERGMLLSGGQRQSIAIARALLFDPPILILDEPTASMDNTTETRMKRRLMEGLKDKTLVLITHKASMLDMVDRIIVMDNGRMVADGPKAQVHEALRQGKLKVS